MASKHLRGGLHAVVEDDAAVAAASILARARYLEEMERLSGEVGLELPRGVTACCLPCARPRFMS
jgi:ribonuclease HIII